MSRKFMIHAHAENPDQEVIARIWKTGRGEELRLYLSVIGTPDAKPRWAIAFVPRTENWDDGVHALACSTLVWADSKEPLGGAVFLYRTKEKEGVGINKTRTGLAF